MGLQQLGDTAPVRRRGTSARGDVRRGAGRGFGAESGAESGPIEVPSGQGELSTAAANAVLPDPNAANINCQTMYDTNSIVAETVASIVQHIPSSIVH